MTVQMFLDQLSLQLGICKVVETKNKRKKSEGGGFRKEIVARGSLSESQSELLKMYWDIRKAFFAKYPTSGDKPIDPLHIQYLRQAAIAVYRSRIYKDAIDRRRDLLEAAEGGWDDWHEVFEDMVKELGVDTPPSDTTS